MTQELYQLSIQAARDHSLDLALVCAVIEQESAWNPWALRYEPAFYAKYVAPLSNVNGLSPTEAKARSMSWGLMQVMGEVAREIGFKGKYLSQLCDPAINLSIGCQHLANKLKRANGDIHKALLSWNGGGNKAYPNEVMARMASYQTTL